MTNGERIRLYQASNASEEAEHIAATITDFHRDHPNIPLSQIAILYRTNAQCKSSGFLSAHFLIHSSSTGIGTSIDECRD